MTSTSSGSSELSVAKVDGTVCSTSLDDLAVEEPLEIRLAYYAAARPGTTADAKLVQRSVSITMRTPGDDAALACGFLWTEGLLHQRCDVVSVRPCGPAVGIRALHNVVRIELSPAATIDLKRLERHFYTNSSCGVCGKTSLEALQVSGIAPLAAAPGLVDAAVIHALPGRLREAQDVFGKTGGLHAAGLFSCAGDLLLLKEDVGRHNAVDKVLGAMFLANKAPLAQRILMVSGRASFELVQKAVVAGIPVMAAVGAPSSLAVELAARFGMTLLGFVRNGRFNVYSGGERLSGLSHGT